MELTIYKCDDFCIRCNNVSHYGDTHSHVINGGSLCDICVFDCDLCNRSLLTDKFKSNDWDGTIVYLQNSDDDMHKYKKYSKHQCDNHINNYVCNECLQCNLCMQLCMWYMYVVYVCNICM